MVRCIELDERAPKEVLHGQKTASCTQHGRSSASRSKAARITTHLAENSDVALLVVRRAHMGPVEDAREQRVVPHLAQEVRRVAVEGDLLAVRRAREGEQERVAGKLVGAPVLDRDVHRETAHLEP